MSAVAKERKSVRWRDICPSHPDDGEHHECMKTEMRCAYCGARVAPYPCHGCGRFMTAAEMNYDDGTHRCGECV